MLQVKDLERLLSEADRKRRDVREKYVALGRRMDTLQGSEEAHRYGIQVAYPPLCRIAMLRHCPSRATQQSGSSLIVFPVRWPRE